MPVELAVTLNRIGILLNFFSFFLAAPEVFGEERLRQYLSRSTGWFIAGIASFVLTLLSLGVVFIVLIFIFNIHRIVSNDIVTTITTVYGVSTYPVSALLLIMLLIFLGLAFVFFIFLRTNRRFVNTISQYLVANGQLRQRLFKLGVVLFVIGNVLQLISTF